MVAPKLFFNNKYIGISILGFTMNKYFTEQETLFDIVTKYPETLGVFTNNGFEQLSDKSKLEALGKSISLENAVSFKGLSLDTFSNLLIEAIESNQSSVDVTLNQSKQISNGLSVVGLLPCPVRIPLLEKFTTYLKSYEEKYSETIKYELKAASMGLSWLEEMFNHVHDAADFPDIFISAGFDMFFGDKLFGKAGISELYVDSTTYPGLNRSFNDVGIVDPKGNYGLISVVPAVFLVNKEVLGDRKIPQSWEDILSPEFEDSVALPVQDFDLFNALLLTIYKEYGEDGVKALGRNFKKSMHPAEAVKGGAQSVTPVVTIVPYFFTRLLGQSETMQAVWPSDGAIVSPIFLISKKSDDLKLQETVDFFCSEEVGTTLIKQGLFPSLHPNVDNELPEDNKFLWLGWDYVYSNNIQQKIKEVIDIFEAKD